MKIDLKRILPASFVPVQKRTSDIWNSNLSFTSSENYIIVAPSGTGKSSLTGYLYGFRNDYTGSISFDGDDIRHLNLNNWSLLRQNKISVVFQDLRLFELLTVNENLLLKCQLASYLNKEVITEYAAHLDISDLLSRKVNTLSMGQKQRVAILRALLQPFEFLIMDEPFSHLDPENTEKAIHLINAVCQKQNASFILTSLDSTYNFIPTKVLYL